MVGERVSGGAPSLALGGAEVQGCGRAGTTQACMGMLMHHTSVADSALSSSAQCFHSDRSCTCYCSLPTLTAPRIRPCGCVGASGRSSAWLLQLEPVVLLSKHSCSVSCIQLDDLFLALYRRSDTQGSCCPCIGWILAPRASPCLQRRPRSRATCTLSWALNHHTRRREPAELLF